MDFLRHEFLRAQDEFYRKITAFTISAETVGTGRECYKFALIYNDAIDRYIRALEGPGATWTILGERQNAREWKSLLANDLNYLSKFRATYPEQIASNGDSVVEVAEMISAAQ